MSNLPVQHITSASTLHLEKMDIVAEHQGHRNPDNQHAMMHPIQEPFGMAPSELHGGNVQNNDHVPSSGVHVDRVIVNNYPTMHVVDDRALPQPRHEMDNPNMNEYAQNADDNQNQMQIKPDLYPENALDLTDSSTYASNKMETGGESVQIENSEPVSQWHPANQLEPANHSEPANQSEPAYQVEPSMERKVDSNTSDSMAKNEPQNDNEVTTLPLQKEVNPHDRPVQKDVNPHDFVTVSFYQFKCKFCTASFDRRKTFKKHLTNEHGILPYVCNLCGTGYDHKSDLKDHVKAHNDEDTDDEDQGDVDQKMESPQVDLEDGKDAVETQSYNVTQINPEFPKLHLTKSLHLLAQVSHMRDTRETKSANPAATEESSTPVVIKTESKTNEGHTVLNKRKRGRPRRLPGAQPAANKRKGRQPRKMKAPIKKEPIKIKIKKSPVRKLRKGKKQAGSEAGEGEAGDDKSATLKKDVMKGNYKLRPQSVDMDYSSQLQQVKKENLPFQCRYCHIDFKTKAKKLSHEKIHKDFQCTTCGVRCSTFKDMKRHEDKHFPDEMKCHFCNELFQLKKDLWAHEETHNEPVVCRWCAATFDKRQDLDVHERLHFISKTSNTIFECHFCQKICKSRKSWKSHLVSHSNIKAYECGICGKKYKQQGSYNLHMQRHNNTFYKYTCQFCGKKYGQKALLIIHERTHTNERPFKCTHCDLSYPSKNQLDHHMQRVLGVKHVCSYCGKQLNSRSSLEIHERIHTGTRPIKCDFCDMDFIEASSYKYHMRVLHTGERFECKYCGKQCKARGVLNAHMRVHTGERPFKCQFCNKAFRSGNVLRTHMQGIHLGVRHKCDLCGREFAQTSALNTHKKLVHEGLKWKDIQIQRKINRANRERHDRELIENAVGKDKSKVLPDPQLHGNAKYPEIPLTKAEVDTLPVSAEAALAAIERSMATSMIPQAAPIMAPSQVAQMIAHTQAPSMAPPLQAHPLVAHTSPMLPPTARPIAEPDRGGIDVNFPPNLSGTAMYHVL